MNNAALIRPGWTPATIALMIIGFMLFWPLGFAMLAYIIWGDRLDGFKRDVNRKTDSFCGAFRRSKRSAHFGREAFGTGNAAFDEWRDKELERLDEERRKLDEMRSEFEEYANELRRAKDREEFDRFMTKRNAVAKKPSGSVPDTNETDQD
jgi:biopolymer transport protein ExbB/TolQ